MSRKHRRRTLAAIATAVAAGVLVNGATDLLSHLAVHWR